MLSQKIKISFFIIGFSLLGVRNIVAQTFQHPIQNVEATWHKITLTEEVLSKVNTNLADVRIYAIGEAGDTLEVPYFLEKQHDQFLATNKKHRVINRSKKGDEYFFTIKLNKNTPINEIDLSFRNKNFNWLLDLQGSQDQKEWFTIEQEYRIVSIVNEITNYQFTTLRFSSSEYQYYQIKLKSEERPSISTIEINAKETKRGTYNQYESNFRVVVNKERKQSIISVDLAKRLPISKIQLAISDSFDFQRPIRINYLVDSIQTQTGWVKNYQSLQASYLSSLEKNEFLFDDIFTSQLQLVVDNHDNTPLNFNNVKVEGVAHQLVARFDKPAAKHWLVYGDKTLKSPRYDIVNFKDKIPEQIPELGIGKQLKLKEVKNEEEPLLTNQWWLWGILIVLIAILGGFTFSMIKGANKQ